MLQQLTGINFIMYYSTYFFDGAHVDSPYMKSLIVNIVNVCSTFPGILVIESWGRRKLLIIGAIGMAICQLLIASFTTAAGADLKDVAQTILVVFCAIYIFFFAASWGPVVWVVTSEIYPLKVRAKSMSVSTASNWLLNFIIAYTTPYMVNKGPVDIGPKIFFVWGTFCIIAIFFVWCMVYETSKITLEQIDELYERVDKAWNSMNFEPSWSFQHLLDEGWAPSGEEPAGYQLQLQQGHPGLPQPPPPARLGSSAGTSVETSLSGSSSAVAGTGPSATEAKYLAQMGNVDLSY
jgi:MFS family permease